MMMNWPYLINSLPQLAIAIMSAMVLWRLLKNEGNETSYPLVFIGILYFISALLNLAWFTGILAPEFVAINSALSVLLAMLFIYLGYRITENKNWLSILIVLFIILNAAYFVFQNPLLVNLIALCSILILFLDLEIFYNGTVKEIGVLGIIFSLLSLLILLLYVLGINLPLSALPDFAIVLLFLKFRRYESKTIRFKKISSIRLPLRVLKFSVFITILSVFLMFGTLALHEIGHALPARFYGCSYKSVIYQSGHLPHTEIECPAEANRTVMLLGAITLTSLIALLFFMTGDRFIAAVSFLIFAFGIIIANNDFIALDISHSLLFLLDAFAAIVIITGISRIIMIYSGRSAGH